MARATFFVVCSLLVGCSMQNPYALFGPSRVPSPASAEISPYYPAGVTAVAPSKSDQALSTRPSISVSTVSEPLAAVPASTSGEEPIRIAENPAAPRTSSMFQSLPVASPSNASPSAIMPAPANLLPPPPSANPAGSFKSGSRVVSDPSVAPATYQHSAPSMRQSLPAPGQWRARP